MATIAKQPNGKFKAIIKSKGRVLKTKTFTRKTDARAWAKRIESDRESMIALGCHGASMTLRELADEYIDQWVGKDQAQPARAHWWVDRLGSRKLIDIDPADIRSALNDYAAGKAMRGDGIDPMTMRPRLKTTTRPRAAGTVNRMRATLSALFRYAEKQGYVITNPVKRVASLSESNKRVRWLSEEERKVLLVACKASSWSRLHLLVLMALMTGARLGELLKLRWSDIDFKDRTALCRDTKNGDDRVLTLPEPAMVELSRFREIGDGLIFPSEKKPHQPYEFRKLWNAALIQAGIDNFRFHDLRHSAASYLVMNGATLHETAEVLGHRSIETTRRYAHLSKDHKKQLTDRILGSLSGFD
ncbi:MAG: site-specific integrase [Candidatus Thiodiazotropha endolucinida]|nr:site-specific integrase [Candidatus Thiodiazotropha taylori]MCW4276971.1 site-specific integrase [Candidatus Thiodiazotropha taylori]